MSPPHSRAFLVTPQGAETKMLRRALETLEGAASLLISDGPGQAELAGALTVTAQRKGIAVLIEYNVKLALTCGADGVMTGGSLAAFRAARSALPKGAIAGARCASRHQAMEIAEAEADFVAFTDPSLIAWWAEIFETPCVSLIPGDENPAADFVRPADTIWASPS